MTIVDSETLNIHCGVPQGSIPGPLIFIMYINSLPAVLRASKTYLYADDTAIVTQADTIEAVSDTLTSELGLAGEWHKNHKLSLNTDKARVMYFGTQKRLANVPTNN